MRFFSILLLFFSTSIALACTSFGVITSDGTILSKNRDYFYSKQSFELVQPIRQFEEWYGNNYHHNNKFYALVAKNDVKFGVNEFGLAAIEEDPPFPSDASAHRRYKQPYQGYSEGMILYGILQNFATVDEIIPYLKPIFSAAAPNFYQIADKNKILTVEVAYGSSDTNPTRAFTYKIMNKINDSFTHTNTYRDPQFVAFNQLAASQDAVNGSNHRLQKITNYVNAAKGDFSQAFSWYLDTASNVGSASDNKYCLNTSIFRSNVKDLKITNTTTSDKIYGTVSSFMVKQTATQTLVFVRILDSLDTLGNGDQSIVFNELIIPLDDLFKNTGDLPYKKSSMLRKAPNNGVCY